MFQEHPVFEEPENNNVKVWRYMDFTKFVSILEKKALFFTRSDKFRDKYEGTIGIFNRKAYPSVYSKYDLSLEQIEKIYNDTINFNMASRERTIISCWHINDYESAAMWDLYLRNNEGIAIQTTYEKLKESFKNENRTIYIGKVKYIDFDNEWTPEGNSLYPFVHKRKSFEHENELRALHWIFPMDSPTPFEFGDYINIDLQLLIDKVYVSPDSPKWFAEIVQSVMLKYDVNKPVVHSNLYELPK
jgi:hypothetical protein